MNSFIDNIKDLFNKNDTKIYYVIAGGVLVTSAISYHVYNKMADKRRKSNYPRDVVIVHGAGRGPYCPSLSPFVLKIETYFRMNRIPYQNEQTLEMSSKGKIPWIEYNGEVINDSAFIIQSFNRKFNIDLNKGLSNKERAVARAFSKLVEEDLIWCVALCRWVYDYDKTFLDIPWWIVRIIGKTVAKNAYAAGMGRHTNSEVLHIFEDNLKAISEFLGNKQFFMGNEPTEVDCTVFGMLSQLLWHNPGQPGETWIKEKYTNLQDYCYRMKGLFWKDWDDCITHGGTREATR